MERPGIPASKPPFTFIGLYSGPNLRVAMKTYRGEKTLAPYVKRLVDGDALKISEPRNEAVYQGPGVFIAGGPDPFVIPEAAALMELGVEEKRVAPYR